MILKEHHKKLLFLICIPVCIAIFLTNGCSIGVVQPKHPEKEMKSVKHLDTKNGPITLTPSNEDPNNLIITFPNINIEQNGVCKLNYKKFYFDFLNMAVVSGNISNDKKYTIWLDTGYTEWMMTNGITIRENNLEILPIGPDGWTGAKKGFCFVEQIQLGSVKLSVPCEYLQQRWEVNLFGLPLWQQKGVLLGLKTLSKFSYIIFDNTTKEVEFSYLQEFKPNNIQQWTSYNFVIKSGHMHVDFPIAGQEIPLFFDTCGYYELVLLDSTWNTLKDKLSYKELKNTSGYSGFLGKYSCSRVRVFDLAIGNTKIKKTDIVIIPDTEKNRLPSNYVGISCFKDLVVVIDFKNSLLWIRNN